MPGGYITTHDIDFCGVCVIEPNKVGEYYRYYSDIDDDHIGGRLKSLPPLTAECGPLIAPWLVRKAKCVS